MTKRFKELAIQAGLKSSHATDREGLSDFDYRKFAELIVRECMEVARQQRNPSNLNYKPSERFEEDLRQHFGIKQ